MRARRNDSVLPLCALLFLCALLASCALLRPAWHYELETRRAARDTAFANDGTELAEIDVKLPYLTVEHDGLPHSKEPPEDMTRVRDAFNAEMDRFAAALPTLRALRASAADERAVTERAGFAFPGGYSVRLEPESVYLTQRLVSVRVGGEAYTGGAHPLPCAAAWNYDLENGRFFAWSELTDRPDELRERLAGEIDAQLAASGAKERYFADLAARVRSLEGAQVYFAEDGVRVAFSAYQLAPFSEGAPEFTVSYEALAPYWNARGQKMLKKEG